MYKNKISFLNLLCIWFCCSVFYGDDLKRPNIVLMMSDDQGWGETGYNGHPHLKTPILDEISETGLRLDRFYAASPICTPSRASVMTGRHANRSGAFTWNWTIRPEEVTIAQVLKSIGYRTGHFGKWHIGAIKKDSALSPKAMGFDEYIAHDNFFEMDPMLSVNGESPILFKGESSEVVVKEALKFIKKGQPNHKPFFIVIWFGSPHDPYSGYPEDIEPYAKLGPNISKRFAEIHAMDRAIGMFRKGLEEYKVKDNTLLWFNSDNGITYEGVPENERKHLYNAGLKGKKGQLTEGGLLVPGLIEWPALITKGIQSSFPCVTSDIMPTLLDLLEVKHPDQKRPMDGISLAQLIRGETMTKREKAIGSWKYPSKSELKNETWLDERHNQMITKTARHLVREAEGKDKPIQYMFYNRKHPNILKPVGEAVWIKDHYKLYVNQSGSKVELYNLEKDRHELINIAKKYPEIVGNMEQELNAWRLSVENSLTGADY